MLLTHDSITKGAIVVYDVTDADTFKKTEQWVSELQKYLPAEIPILIAGNKCDERKFDVDQAIVEKFARSVNS